MTADAVVVAARPDGSVDLEFEPPKRCQGCSGVCLWKRLRRSRIERMPVRHRLAPGAAVSVTLSASRVLLISMLLYGAPLAAILIGATLGAVLGASDLATLAGASCGAVAVAIGFGALRREIERATLAGLVVTVRS